MVAEDRIPYNLVVLPRPVGFERHADVEDTDAKIAVPIVVSGVDGERVTLAGTIGT